VCLGAIINGHPEDDESYGTWLNILLTAFGVLALVCMLAFTDAIAATGKQAFGPMLLLTLVSGIMAVFENVRRAEQLPATIDHHVLDWSHCFSSACLTVLVVWISRRTDFEYQGKQCVDSKLQNVPYL